MSNRIIMIDDNNITNNDINNDCIQKLSTHDAREGHLYLNCDK